MADKYFVGFEPLPDTLQLKPCLVLIQSFLIWKHYSRWSYINGGQFFPGPWSRWFFQLKTMENFLVVRAWANVLIFPEFVFPCNPATHKFCVESSCLAKVHPVGYSPMFKTYEKKSAASIEKTFDYILHKIFQTKPAEGKLEFVRNFQPTARRFH